MSSTEVYRIARLALGPWCKQNGFKRTSGGMLGWYKLVGDQFLVFWFQVSNYGWDRDYGSAFVIEFQISRRPVIGDAINRRWRLPKFLTEWELEYVRRMQNVVIAKLERPNRDYCLGRCGPFEAVIKSYLAKFDPVVNRYTERDDIWLRYKDKEDVEQWIEFVRRVLPRILESLSTAAI